MTEHATLIKKFHLTPEIDFFVNEKEGNKIITRSGFLKIKRIIEAEVTLEMISLSADHQYCVIKASGKATLDNKPRTSQMLGEVSPKNNTYAPYPIAVAQKRAEGRVVIDLAGLSEEGYMTEDEPSTVPDTIRSIVKDPDNSITKAETAIKEELVKKKARDEKKDEKLHKEITSGTKL